MPSRTTFFRWLAQRPDFHNQYVACARERAAAIFEETLEIADDGTNDVLVTEDGKEIVQYDHIQRSKLRVDTRKWFLAKLMPRVYGEKPMAAEGDNETNTVVIRGGLPDDG